MFYRRMVIWEQDGFQQFSNSICTKYTSLHKTREQQRTEHRASRGKD